MQKKDSQKEISILAEIGTAIYSILPIVEELVKRDVKVFIYTNRCLRT